MRALWDTTTSLSNLLFPPQIVEIKLQNRFSTWRISAKGTSWEVSRTRARKGRPRRDAELERSIREADQAVYPAVRQLKKKLRRHYQSLSPGQRRRWQTVRKTTEEYLPRCRPQDLLQFVASSGSGEDAVLVWDGKQRPEIAWNDFLEGSFAPRDLALVIVGASVGRAPSTVRNILKSTKKDRK
jgi:hypothetical protein